MIKVRIYLSWNYQKAISIAVRIVLSVSYTCIWQRLYSLRFLRLCIFLISCTTASSFCSWLLCKLRTSMQVSCSKAPLTLVNSLLCAYSSRSLRLPHRKFRLRNCKHDNMRCRSNYPILDTI